MLRYNVSTSNNRGKRIYRIQLSPLITPLDGTSEKSILSMLSSGNAMCSS